MKGVTKENINKYALYEFLTEYKELNADNKYKPVAVGRYGIRKRESIYSKELAKDYSKNKLIHKNTLTVGMGSKQIDIGILIEDETFAVSPAYHTYKIQGIRCKYLEYCLQSKNIEMFSLYAKRGSRQGKSIDLKRWLTYKIPVYSEEDQIVIEENLNKINVVIELRRKQLELLDELVRARFVEMFGDLRINDKGWKYYKLDELTELITDGEHATPKRTADGIYLLSARNVLNHHLSLEDVDFIDCDEFDRISRRIIPREGDVLISCSGSIGRCCVVPKNIKFQMVRSVALLRFKSNINPVFAEYMITSDYLQDQINKSKTASSQANLFQGKIKSLKGVLPPLELQNQFASFVQEIDKSRLRELLAIKQIKLLLHDSWFLFY